MGALFAKELVRRGAAVTLVDLHQGPTLPGTSTLVGDIVRPTEAIRTVLHVASVVMLAIPEDVAIKSLPGVLDHLGPGALLVDTLSVKTPYAAALAGYAGTSELLGLNPMFAPDLGFTGRSIIAVPYREGVRTAAFLDFVSTAGAKLVVMDADAHDRACAALQAATHAAVLAFGLALRAANHDVATLEPISPPPHRTLLALLARILAADPEVYRDIQTANPYAAEMRRKLGESLHLLEAVTATGDPDAFARMLDDLKPLLGERANDYAEMCAALFGSAAMRL